MKNRIMSQIRSNGILILQTFVILLLLLAAFSTDVIAQTSLSRVSLVSGNWTQTTNRNYWIVEFWECPQELRCAPQMCENHSNGINDEIQYVFTGMNGSNFSFNYTQTTSGSYSSTVYEWGGTVGICCVDSEVNPVNNSGSGTSELTLVVLNAGTYRTTVFPYTVPPEFDLRYDECGLSTPDPNTPSGYITRTGESSYSIKLDCSPEESERTISHIHIESTHMGISGDTMPSGNELLINGIAPSYSQQSYGGYNNYERYYSWSGFLKWDIRVDQQCGSTVTLSHIISSCICPDHFHHGCSLR